MPRPMPRVPPVTMARRRIADAPESSSRKTRKVADIVMISPTHSFATFQVARRARRCVSQLLLPPLLPQRLANMSGGTSQADGHGSWGQLSAIQKVETLMASQHDAARAREAAKREIAEGIVAEVTDHKSKKGVSITQQADLSLHTLDAWEQRYSLRRTKGVREILRGRRAD